MSALVEEMIDRSWSAFLELDSDLALQVIEGDEKINEPKSTGFDPNWNELALFPEQP